MSKKLTSVDFKLKGHVATVADVFSACLCGGPFEGDLLKLWHKSLVEEALNLENEGWRRIAEGFIVASKVLKEVEE